MVRVAGGLSRDVWVLVLGKLRSWLYIDDFGVVDGYFRTELEEGLSFLDLARRVERLVFMLGIYFYGSLEAIPEDSDGLRPEEDLSVWGRILVTVYDVHYPGFEEYWYLGMKGKVRFLGEREVRGILADARKRFGGGQRSSSSSGNWLPSEIKIKVVGRSRR